MATPSQSGLVKGLGLVDSTTLVMGSMIGSGVFIVAADISRQVQSPGLLIMTWVVTAILTLIAALSYGELAAAMPHAGGQYIYLREAFGPMYGFLYGWTLFMVIQTGTIAAVVVAFAKYAGVFLPWISAQNYLIGSGKIGLTTQQLVAIGIIVLLTAINTRGIRTGAMVQNVFTFAKVGALLGLVLCGFLVGRNSEAIASNFTGFMRNADWGFTTIRLVGVAMVGRHVARHYDDGHTLEVNRTCTDGTPNANSALYAAAWRAAKALGYQRLITYTQAGESGSSLTGAGWRIVAERPARESWAASSVKLAHLRHPVGAGGIARTLWEAS